MQRQYYFWPRNHQGIALYQKAPTHLQDKYGNRHANNDTRIKKSTTPYSCKKRMSINIKDNSRQNTSFTEDWRIMIMKMMMLVQVDVSDDDDEDVNNNKNDDSEHIHTHVLRRWPTRISKHYRDYDWTSENIKRSW